MPEVREPGFACRIADQRIDYRLTRPTELSGGAADGVECLDRERVVGMDVVRGGVRTAAEHGDTRVLG